MRTITYADAIREAMSEEMRRDDTVIFLGEDIGVYGGAFGVSRGMLEEFGEERVRDTPISEAAITGAAVGAAMKGLRPICEIMFSDFMTLAMDQLVNQAAKTLFQFGGQASVPMVCRTPAGSGTGAAEQHSQSLEALFYHIPGLKIIMPSTPYDAKGLLKSAIRDNCPVIFIEHKLLYQSKGLLPEHEYLIPIGKADIKKEGKDITVVATSNMVKKVISVADRLKDTVDIEVIDPRTLSPLDMDTILDSVKKTNKLIIVQEAARNGGVASDISSKVVENAFDYLDCPVKIIAGENTVIPFSYVLESLAIPDERRIEEEIIAFIKNKG